MRFVTVGLVAGFAILTVGAAIAMPPASRELMLPFAGKASAYVPTDQGGGSVPTIARGQSLGIACADIGKFGAKVRVVLQIAQELGERATGYEAVLATEQTLDHGKVHVRVPDLPSLSDHTVDVKVYVTGNAGTHICDGGRVRIT